jgi:hypothetical protein
MLGFLGCLVAPARAEFQFDVFIGYDGVIHQMNWLPVVCEVKNDGPGFKGVFELSNSQLGQGQARRMTMDFPPNTQKRFVVPVFAERFGSWNARLLDERGKERAIQTNLRARRSLYHSNFLLGALPRTFGGLPSLPDLRPNQEEFQPSVAHLRTELFPDNPICLEGLNALYLNTEKALDLKAPQAGAIVAWLHAGGHLIVGLEQPGDLNGAPWLKGLIPAEFQQTTSLSVPGAIQEWLAGKNDPFFANLADLPQTAGRRPNPGQKLPENSNPFANLPADPAFEQGTVNLSTAEWREGTKDLAVGGMPLVVRIPRGRGLLTVLSFSPEREPFRSWKNRAWFWARLAQVPISLLGQGNINPPGGYSLDGVFGSMIESRQIRKLPISWLLLLLVVYLAVIGPVDYLVLKRLNKTMLTWITFPCYVAFFSFLIYFIGYKLRAGETECNELSIVDLFPRTTGAEMRGRTYLSIYSPANSRFALSSDQTHTALRGETRMVWGGDENSRISIEHHSGGFQASVFVPVWTSQLYVHDWWQTAGGMLSARFARQGNSWQMTVTNQLDHALDPLFLTYKDRAYKLGSLPAKSSLTFDSAMFKGEPLVDFIQRASPLFGSAVQARQQAFGNDPHQIRWDPPANTCAASYISQASATYSGPQWGNQGHNWSFNFAAPNGMDLTAVNLRGEPMLMAWDPGHLPVRSLRQFEARRKDSQTLFRLQMPVVDK